MRQKPNLHPSFTTKKNAILASLSNPESTYTDLSPKGSVDAAIKPLIDRINALEGIVTTSSCAGRVSVFFEGRKQGKGYEGRGDAKDKEGLGKESEQAAVPGGKGMGGKWLFVSHEPVELSKKGEAKENLPQLLGLGSLGEPDKAPALSGEVDEMRLVRFQFEPMVCRKSSIERNLSDFFLKATTMLQMLRRGLDSPHHDRFPTPCPTRSCSSHQRRLSRKRHPEPQKLRRS